MTVLFYASYVGVLVAFAFITLSLANGLLYIAELIEEYSKLAKIIGQRGIYMIIALHILLYFTDSLPLKQILFSIFCHIVYLQNFTQAWPVISLSSIAFIASCCLVVADHFLWFFYFTHLTQEAKHQRYYKGHGRATTIAPSFTEIATFMGACVWLAPLFLFLSLSANDHAIPLRSAEPSSPSVSKTQFIQKPRRPLLRSMLSKLPGSKFSRNEGIITPPRSRSTPPVGEPLPSPAIGGTYRNALSPPPKSPVIRQSPSLDFHSPNANNFQLSTPPRRSSSGLRNNSTAGEGIGLGLRRVASSNISSSDNRKED